MFTRLLRISLWLASAIALAAPIPSWSAQQVDIVNQDFVGSTIQVTRSGNAYVRDENGDWVLAPPHTPRIQRNRNGEVLGLLVEHGATNYLLNSETPADQSVSLATGTYTLWMEGTGSVTVSQGTAAGTNFGIVHDGSPRTFSVTGSGAVTIDVSGTVERFQLENLAYPSSYILTGAAPVTRQADLISDEELLWYCQCGMTVVARGWGPPAGQNNSQIVHLNSHVDPNVAPQNYLRIRRGSSGELIAQSVVNGASAAVLNLGALAPGEFFSVAFRIEPNGTISASRDGGTVVSDSGALPDPIRMDVGSVWSNNFWIAPLRQITMIKGAVSNAELQSLSTYSGTVPDLDHPGSEPQDPPLTLIEGKDRTAPSTTLQKPAFAGTYEDPAYGPTVRRVTDYTQIPGATRQRNDYSRRNPFNADSSRFLTIDSSGRWYVHETSDWSYRELPLGGGSTEPHWHPTNRDILITLGANFGDHRLIAHDVTDDSRTVIANFFQVNAIEGDTGKTDIRQIWPNAARFWTRWEGSPSQVTTSTDYPRYWSFMVNDGTDSNYLGLITYDLQTDEIVGVYDFATDGNGVGRPDHVSMSPSGEYVVPAWDVPECSGTVDPTQLFNASQKAPCGIMAFSRDFSTVRVLDKRTRHSDTGRDAAGNDVLVYIDHTTGWLTSVELATGAEKELWYIWEKFEFDGFQTAGTAMHISTKNFDKPGWALISTYNPREEAHWYANKIFAIELTANPRILNIAHTYNTYNGNYYTEVMAAVNRDFTRILFNSNWNSGNTDPDAYLIELPPGTIPDANP